MMTVACSITDGLLFYLFITVPSVFIGAALALLSIFVSRKLRHLVFILIFLAVLSITFFELYYNPQIYFYNPVYAYFPGTLYDEALSIDQKLMIYRAINFIFFGIIYFISLKVLFNKSTLSKRLVIYLTVLTASLFLYFSPDFGFSTTQNKLRHVLNRRVSTEHFDIYFSQDIKDDRIKIITLHHEYYFNVLSKFYQINPRGKYISFIFGNNDQKKKYFGSENADVSKPWLRETFTSADDYDVTLRHEIAHCFAGEFGWSIFHVAGNFNPALIEGAAVAGSPDYDLNSVHYLASLAYNNGYKVNLGNLFSGMNFFGQTSGLSYIYAGSFCNYLINTYGINQFKKLYSTLEFKTIYGADINQLQEHYFAFLAADFKAVNRAEADYYFAKKPIIYKICPRYVADRLRKAWNLYYDKDYKQSLEIFTEILQLTNNYSALMGYSNTLYSSGQEEKAISYLEDNLKNYENTSYYYNIEFRLADLYSERNDTLYSESLYKKIIDKDPNRSLSYLAKLRIALIDQDSLIVPYLKGSDVDKYLIVAGLNKMNYDYNSFPVMIDLAQSLGETYDLFVSSFNKTLVADNEQSSFALYKLSAYMTSHLDFLRGRKMAALAMRYDKDKNLNFVLKENYDKISWFYEHGTELLSSINFK
jgi:tetratricopeptide (TPR) repeat protein